MSLFDQFRADPVRVATRLEALRARFPDATLEADVVDGMIIMRGEVATTDDRQAIVRELREIEPDLTPVVAGGLKRRAMNILDDPAYRSRPAGSSRTLNTSLSTRTTKRIYRVQPGDTLASIANRFYGDPGGVRIVAAANGDLLEDPDRVEPGWMLEIPEVLNYHARPGDTLEGLSRRFYGDSARQNALAQANPELELEAGQLRAGQIIRIPFR